MKNSLRTFRTGTSAMWVNNKQARVIKRRLKATGDLTSYPEVVLMRKSSQDTSKLLQAGFVWLAAPELLAVSLYFFPRMIPSTFESAEGREKRYRQIAQLRAKATLGFLKEVDNQAVRKGKPGRVGMARRERAELLLRAKKSSTALAAIEPYATPGEDEKERKAIARAPLKGIPGYALVAAVTAIGVSGPLPRFMRLSALKRHLEQLVTEDEVLRRTNLASLDYEYLVEACFDRGLGSVGAPSAVLRSEIEAWLRIVDHQAGETDPLRMRLAALATCAVFSVRSGDDFPLSRMLYAP